MSISSIVQLTSGSNTISDGELLQRFASRRDDETFRLIVRRHGSLVWNVCRRNLQNAETAEDAFQATFLVLIQQASRLRLKGSLSTWLYGVARRIAHRSRMLTQRSVPTGTTDPLQNNDDPYQQVSVRELITAVQSELDRLPKHYRVVLELCLFGEKSINKTAQQLQLSPGVVKGCLHRGRLLLQQRLLKRGITPIALASLIVTTSNAGAVPHGLIVTTVQLLKISVPARIVSLVATMPLSKTSMVLTFALLLFTAGTGAVLAGKWRNETHQDPEYPQQVVVAQDKESDALPEGAVRRLGSTRFRLSHTGIRFTPDGKYFVTNRNNALVYLDPNTGSEVKRVIQTPYQIQNWAISPDGKTALIYGYTSRNLPSSVSGNGSLPWYKLDLWDLTSGSLLRPLNWKADTSLQFPRNNWAQFSPDGKRVLTNHFGGSRSNTNIMWDVSTGNELWKQPDLGKPNTNLIGFLDQGRSILIYLSDRNSQNRQELAKFCILNTMTGKEIRSFTAPSDLGWEKTLSPDGKTVYLSSTSQETRDYWIRSWNVVTGEELAPLKGHQLWGNNVVLSPDGNYVATSSRDQTVRIWKLADAKCLHVIDTAPMVCNNLAFHPDSKSLWMMTGNWPKRYEIPTGKLLTLNNHGHESSLMRLAYSHDGRTLWTTSYDRTLRSWDVATGRELMQRRDSSLDQVTKAAIPDDRTLIAFHGLKRVGDNSFDSKLQVQELATGTVKATYDTSSYGNGDVIFSPQGDRIASIGSSGTEVWSLQTNNKICQIKDAQGSNCITWTPNGDQLIATSRSREPGHGNECTNGVWDARTGQLLRTLGHDVINAMAFSPHGQTIAFACQDKSIKLIEFATGKDRLVIDDLPVRAYWHFAFSPDGRWFATEVDREIWVWNAYTGVKIVAFTGHENGTTFFAFSPDSKSIATAGYDGTVLIWNLSSKVQKLTPPVVRSSQEAQQAWEALKKPDSKTAYQAMNVLTLTPNFTVQKAKEELHAVTGLTQGQLAQLLGDLDSPQFNLREQATKELKEGEDQVIPALQKLLEGKPSLELKRRAQSILDSIYHGQPSAEALLHLRAIEVLERIGTKPVQIVLETIAQGNSLSQRTKAARAALERLQKKRME